MRALRLLTFSFVFAMLLANCQAAQAQIDTYELGPFHVEGFGATPNEGMEEAYCELWDLILAIEAALPPGHVVLDFEVIVEGFTTPTIYEIDFYIIAWDPTPPPPPFPIN